MEFYKLKGIYQCEFDISKYIKKRNDVSSAGYITKTQLNEMLHRLNTAESIYQRYYGLKNDPDAQILLLESLSLDTLLAFGMQFPDHGLMILSENYAENLSFTEQQDHDVMLAKHPCYSPIIAHAHDFYEAVYVLEGCIGHTVDGRSFSMSAGDLCMITPGVKHYLEVFSKDAIAINILIRRSTFTDVFYNLLRGSNIVSFYFLSTIFGNSPSSYILFHTAEDPMLKELVLDMMLEFQNKQKYYSDILNSSLVTFLAKLLRFYGECYELPAPISESEMLSRTLLSYFQKNYKTASLGELASYLHFSEPYTSRLIKKATGQTFTQLLLQIRMNRAAKLLKTTSITLTELCEEIGYLNPEHLIRTFKKYYGVTPTEYRRNHL